MDEAHFKGQIGYAKADQVETVREIVKLVAADPPTAMVSRLIYSFNKVTSCQRKKDE